MHKIKKYNRRTAKYPTAEPQKWSAWTTKSEFQQLKRVNHIKINLVFVLLYISFN